MLGWCDDPGALPGASRVVTVRSTLSVLLVRALVHAEVVGSWVGLVSRIPLWGSPVSRVDADKVSHRRHWSASIFVLR